jgi:Phage protein Gp138 N-terminal domain
MDYTQVPDAQTQAELSGDRDIAIMEYIETRLRDLHTCLPGQIVSFNPATQTAVVQPSIKRVFVVNNPGQGATVSQVNLPLCVDVPVQFPGGNGYALTFPVVAGDECWLMFSERAIDFWFQNGGQQLPSEYRLHDLSDAVATVGLRSQPNVVADFSTSACELRSRDGSIKISLSSSGIIFAGAVTFLNAVNMNNNLTVTGNADLSGGDNIINGYTKP